MNSETLKRMSSAAYEKYQARLEELTSNDPEASALRATWRTLYQIQEALEREEKEAVAA